MQAGVCVQRARRGRMVWARFLRLLAAWVCGCSRLLVGRVCGCSRLLAAWVCGCSRLLVGRVCGCAGLRAVGGRRER